VSLIDPSDSTFVIWFTGISGAGKSTIALVVEERLREGDSPCTTLTVTRFGTA